MSKNIPALSIQNVDVGYDKKPVIRHISIDIMHGETFGLIGLNGAGKTTLIKAILGMRTPLAGEISICGFDRYDARAKAKTSYLPERFEPPWFLTGMEFIHFSLSLYGRKEDDEDIKKAAESLALDPGVHKNRVQTYSKGMRQKLGLLATLLTGCDVLILDEPMSGLDPRARARVKDFLSGLKKEGRTVFLSSHILADMSEMCDRVAVLHDGIIRFTGAPQELLKETGTKTLERAFLEMIEKSEAA